MVVVLATESTVYDIFSLALVTCQAASSCGNNNA
jgi:hypothetical protein